MHKQLGDRIVEITQSKQQKKKKNHKKQNTNLFGTSWDNLKHTNIYI